MTDIYQQITDRILSTLDDAGNWKPCWRGMKSGMPTNANTKAQYRGANVLNLWLTAEFSDYPTHEWASYKQWRAMDAQVRKGEKGTPVIFYKQMKSDDPEDNGYIFARTSHVFNAAQVEGYEPEIIEPTQNERIARCEHLFGHIANTALIRHNDEGRAYYRPSDDTVTMPHFNQFETAEHYYSVLSHELIHWTGNSKRLDREFAARGVDKETYAKEELVAELGAAFMCGTLGIDTVTRDDHTAYLASWLKALKNDKRLIVRAASLAATATDYLLAVASGQMEEAA